LSVSPGGAKKEDGMGGRQLEIGQVEGADVVPGVAPGGEAVEAVEERRLREEVPGLTRVRITDVQIGQRRREDYGDLSELARSISQYGLLHPIVIDGKKRLVAGERRLRAYILLDEEWIEARDFGSLTGTERRQIELEENLQRKDLTAYERSKNLLELVEVGAEVLREEEEKVRSDSGELLTDLSKNSSLDKRSRGRPRKAGSQKKIGARIRKKQPEISRAQRHVDAAERYPFLKASDWSQDAALNVAGQLDSLSKEQRETVLSILAEPDNDAAAIQRQVRNYRALSTEGRDKIVRLWSGGSGPDREYVIQRLYAEVNPKCKFGCRLFTPPSLLGVLLPLLPVQLRQMDLPAASRGLLLEEERHVRDTLVLDLLRPPAIHRP
jgi:ParB/RepB/Spo0J family partition protein